MDNNSSKANLPSLTDLANALTFTSSADEPPFIEADIATWSESDYYRLLEELSPIFSAPRGTPEAARCEVIANLIWSYEQVHYHADDAEYEARKLGELVAA